MENSNTSSVTITNTCQSRLPCGLCLITNQLCSYINSYIYTTTDQPYCTTIQKPSCTITNGERQTYGD